jgi:hypothetical protein
MADDIDDDADRWFSAALPAPGAHAGHAPTPLAPRLVARLYGGANASLRARILGCLLRPLGPLGLVAVASGAFAGFLSRATPAGFAVALDDAQRFSREQVFELARFAEQVDPQALQQITGLLADGAMNNAINGPLGVAAFSAAAVPLLVRVVRRS